MCCATDKAVENSEVNLMNADAAASATQQQDAALTFGEQQSVLNSLNAKMSYMAANPMGYSPSELATMTTDTNEQAATGAKQAIGAAAAFGAAHGAADVGGGGAAELAGQIGSAATTAKQQSLTNIAQANAQLKQQNYWKAISGLSGVGADLGGSTGTALSAETGLSGASTGAGSGAINASNAITSETAGILGGIGGLIGAGAGIGGVAGNLAENNNAFA